MREILGLAAMAVAVLIGLWVGIVYRFAHPEATETQLFLANWQYAAAILVLSLVAALLLQPKRP